MMQIRKMTTEDAAELVSLSALAGLHPWSEDSFVGEANNPVADYRVLDLGGTIIGYVGMWLVIDEAQIMNVAVLPEHWHRGYGQTLMQDAMTAARTAGCTVMTLEVKANNVPALGLYEKLGFQANGKRKGYYPDGTDGILMSVIL